MAKEVKDTKIFITELYPHAEKSLKTHGSTYQRHIAKFIDNNSEVLYSQGPSKRLYFSDDDRDELYRAIGISPMTLKATIKKSDLIDASWKILNEPFNLGATLAIRYYQVNKKKKELEAAILYLSFAFYSSIQYKYFPYEPNENIMSYTINNLSNKFKIKQLGNVFKAIHSTAMTNHETWAKKLEQGTDLIIKDYIMSLKTRLDGLIQKIANEFYETKEKGHYLNTEEDRYDEENFYQADNNSFVITRLAETATLKTLSRGINHDLVRTSANIAGVSVTALRNAVIAIVDKKDKEIKELFILILQLYLMDGKHQPDMIRSKQFVEFCLEVYIKSNTNDETIIKIKDLLDEWLTLCSPNYVKTERIATKNNFRKATFLYFVFVLQNSYSRG
jgi:hypothetical protein